MNIERPLNELSAREYAALMDAARSRAIELRREAIRSFWSAVGRGVRSGWHAVRAHVMRPLPHARSEA